MRCVVGIDWASERHQVEVQTEDGTVLWNDGYATNLESLYQLRKELLAAVDAADELMVGIEDPNRPVVRVLLEANIPVFVLSPAQTNALRKAYSQAERKDDAFDAHIICDELRVHQNLFYRLVPLPAKISALSDYSRAYESAKEDVTRFTNRLRDKLREYFPQFLELEWELDSRVILDLLELIPAPNHVDAVTVEQVEQVLQRCRKHSARQVLEILGAEAPPLDGCLLEASAQIASCYREQLRMAKRARDRWSDTLEALLGEISDKQRTRELPSAASANSPHRDDEETSSEPRVDSDGWEGPTDIEIVLSVHGIGPKSVAGLLGEGFQAIVSGDRQLLRRQSIAPVTRKSGKSESTNGPPPLVQRRYARNKHLNNTMHQIGDSLQKHNGHYRAKYVGMREHRGHTHGRACRQIADQFLRVLFAMLRDRTTYDANLHGASRR